MPGKPQRPAGTAPKTSQPITIEHVHKRMGVLREMAIDADHYNGWLEV